MSTISSIPRERHTATCPLLFQFSVKSDVRETFESDDSGTQFTMTRVTRNDVGYYWCEARSPDRSNPEVENTVESELKAFLDVQCE